MNSRALTKDNKGFTIIEVMIVLAIAGLIILIVFLAVPALQRNSRNTQRKNDVAAVLGAYSEYASNRGGVLPDVNSHGAAIANAKLGIYAAGSVTYRAAAATMAVATGTNVINTATVTAGAKCAVDANGAQTGAGTSTGASPRQLIVMYHVETGGNPQPICQES